MNNASHDSILPLSSRPGATWQAYIADLLRSPGKAKAALIGCCILMVTSPASLSAMMPFTTASFAMQTGRPLPEAILLFVAIPLLISPLILPIAGAWVDRWGARRVAVPAVILYAATTALVPLSSGALWLLGPVLVLASVFGFVSSLAVVFKVISAWFPRHRGIGFALMGAVSSLAAAALSPVFQRIIGGSVSIPASAMQHAAPAFTALGWDGAYYAVAITIGLISIPTAFFLLSEPLDRSAHATVSRASLVANRHDVPGVPLGQALRTRTWVFIALFLALAAAGPMAVRQVAVNFFAERGFDPPTIAVSLSALFVASVAGLFIGGIILDRTSKPWVVVPMLAAVPIGLALAYINHGAIPLLFAATTLLGFAMGAESALGPFLIARYFGLKSFAQLQGLTLAISTLTLGLSPFLVSAVQTATGSYLVPFAVLIGLTAIAPILAALLPKYPADWKQASAVLDTSAFVADPRH